MSLTDRIKRLGRGHNMRVVGMKKAKQEVSQYSHGHINDVIGAGLEFLYILGGPRGSLVALVTKRDSGGGGVGSVIQ